MESKVHIRIDQLEVDCEGSEEFVRVELPKILEAVSKFNQIAGSDTGRGDDGELTARRTAGPKSTRVTTATVAAKLDAKTGTDVAMAAAAKLALVDSQDEFSRDDLLTEMKNAKGFYKKTHSGNLSAHLNSLVKQGKLHEVSADRYSIPQSVKSNMEQLLG